MPATLWTSIFTENNSVCKGIYRPLSLSLFPRLPPPIYTTHSPVPMPESNPLNVLGINKLKKNCFVSYLKILPLMNTSNIQHIWCCLSWVLPIIPYEDDKLEYCANMKLIPSSDTRDQPCPKPALNTGMLETKKKSTIFV